MGNCQKQSEPDIRVINQIRTGPVEELKITCLTWNKDYQGLFDYETKDITQVPISARQTGALLKMGENFNVFNNINKTLVAENADNFLFRFTRKTDSFAIQPITIEAGNVIYEKSIWMVVKSTPDRTYTLKEGDVLKLGRQRIRVKEKILKDKEEEERPKPVINTKQILYENLTKNNASKTKTNLKAFTTTSREVPEVPEPAPESHKPDTTTPTTEEAGPLCRICLDPGLNSNPLITPCKCAGSMKYIHLLCLQMWLGKRLSPTVLPHSVVINWKPLLCQLCTSHFLYKIYLDNKKYYTVQIPRPPKPYLVFEVVHKDKTKKKVYHLVSFAQKRKLCLGRKHDIDVRISEDISVSRNHASVNYDPDTSEFYIEDNSSKFGTLVLIRKKLVVRDTTPNLSLQVGPNVFKFQVVRGIAVPGQEYPQKAEEEEMESEEEQQYQQDGVADEEQEAEEAEEDEQGEAEDVVNNDVSLGGSPVRSPNRPLQKRETRAMVRQESRTVPVIARSEEPGPPPS